jgi:hypothetical protein
MKLAQHPFPLTLHPQETYGRTRKGNLHPTSPAILGRGNKPIPISILESAPSRNSNTKFLTSTVNTACREKRRQNQWPPHTPPTHFELGHRKILPQTHPRPIPKGKQVSMPLNFFRLGRYPILTVSVLEPSTWPEDFGVLTPKRGGAVHGLHRDRNQRAGGDRQAVDQLTTLRVYGFREWNDIIFDGLCKHHIIINH